MYTGVKVIEVKPELINILYSEKAISIDFDGRYKFYQNEYIVIKSEGVDSAIGRVSGQQIILINTTKSKSCKGIYPRNKEQHMAVNALMNNDIGVVTLTGRAGVGKSLLALATAMEKIDKGEYDRLILTRPMSFVGKYSLGALPGAAEEKFSPYLQNYICNIQAILGRDTQMEPQDIIDQYRMEFIPMQLIRGASWPNSIVVLDECQVLGHDEMVALGTRVGEDSKLIILGDLNQRDEKIVKEKTGLYKFVNSEITKNSPLTSSIEMWKCERGPISKLFADVFDR